MTNETIIQIILMLLPVLLIQLGMAVYALVDLSRRERVRGPRWAWALGLVLSMVGFPSGLIVSGVYLAWGRHVEDDNDSD